MRSWLSTKRRGSNAIELFFSVGPILFMTLAFTQFYFLANAAYFGMQEGYAKAFKTAYQADHTTDTDDELARDDFEADVYIVPIFRPFLGNQVRRNWDPPGDLHMGGDGEYWIAGGSQADWWEVWDPGIGMIGLVEQYIDFPWGGINISSVAPYEASDFNFDTDGMTDMANDAQEESDEAAAEALEEACEDMQDMISEQIAYRNKANACRNPATWTQMTLSGQPLYYEEGDEGPGEDLYFMVDPPGEDDPDPADLRPAYPAQYYTCIEDDYIEKEEPDVEYGYSSAAQAESDYQEAVQAIAATQDAINDAGC